MIEHQEVPTTIRFGDSKELRFGVVRFIIDANTGHMAKLTVTGYVRDLDAKELAAFVERYAPAYVSRGA